jgi:hypothetical protein
MVHTVTKELSVKAIYTPDKLPVTIIVTWVEKRFKIAPGELCSMLCATIST